MVLRFKRISKPEQTFSKILIDLNKINSHLSTSNRLLKIKLCYKDNGCF